jgi:hypothetical protein
MMKKSVGTARKPSAIDPWSIFQDGVRAGLPQKNQIFGHTKNEGEATSANEVEQGVSPTKVARSKSWSG